MTADQQIHYARLQGMAAALAEIYRLHGCTVEIGDVLEGFGLTLDTFKRAGVESYDLDAIRDAIGAAA